MAVEENRNEDPNRRWQILQASALPIMGRKVAFRHVRCMMCRRLRKTPCPYQAILRCIAISQHLPCAATAQTCAPRTLAEVSAVTATPCLRHSSAAAKEVSRRRQDETSAGQAGARAWAMISIYLSIYLSIHLSIYLYDYPIQSSSFLFRNSRLRTLPGFFITV